MPPLGVREDWFPTSVWYFDHPDPVSFNAEILKLVLAERAADPSGLENRSSPRGWHSRDDLHNRPDWTPFAQHATGCIEEVVNFLCWDRSLAAPAWQNCWAIVNGPGASNIVHSHPNCVLSGAYYVCAPAKCGRIFFLDPRPAATAILPPLAQFTSWTYRRVHYEPVAGRLLLFPSWLWHGVETNESAEDRICLSFNIGLR